MIIMMIMYALSLYKEIHNYKHMIKLRLSFLNLGRNFLMTNKFHGVEPLLRSLYSLN